MPFATDTNIVKSGMQSVLITAYYRSIVMRTDSITYRVISGVSDFHAIMPASGDPAL